MLYCQKWENNMTVENEAFDVIMPTILGYKIMTPDQKSVISEHGPDELQALRKLIEGTDNIIQYIFKKVELE